ncbi:MAG: M20/M25/M40 family metallo-hydrolase [Firmicutes bacterium]|mgnify:CR=1 FL=1|nr:M20/M25/M40 family metallo-hydrolase [Bacillota bacterium]
MVNKERLLQTFLEIVRVNSQTKKERAMADYLKAKLQELGLAVTEDGAGEAIGGNAGNVIGVLKGSAEKKALLFSAHMDRVAPGENIKAVVEDDIVRSGGDTILGSDDGAGLAGILELLRIIRERQIPHGRIEVVFTIAEEGGLNGAKSLDTEKLQAKHAIILDSTGKAGTVINRAPAQDEIIAKIRGRAAHAGVEPEKGINAILVAAKAVSRMQLGRLDAETTANIGVIAGGTATNIIPDYVEVRGEARSLREEKLVRATEAMAREFMAAAGEENAQVDLTVNRLYPAFHLPEEHELLQLVKRAGEACDVPVTLMSTGGGSDANIFNGKGIAAVNLAVGNEEVHTVNEYLVLPELVKTVALAVKIVELA